VFERYRGDLSGAIRQCSSGRELDARGQIDDLALASALDASACAPRFDGAAFLSWPPSGGT